ncbi:uncharacterized protein LOC128248166 isoform X2 [Octopus bimaculoides]|nr:uncharacterized protein LOC128248166 isoform X2 [Octopus bimaculoides]
MYIFPVTLFSLLILPNGVTNAPFGCNGCNDEVSCFCSEKGRRINPSLEHCNEISCLNPITNIMVSYCKDTEGQCLTGDYFAFGATDFRCRSLYCRVPPIEFKKFASWNVRIKMRNILSMRIGWNAKRIFHVQHSLIRRVLTEYISIKI